MVAADPYAIRPRDLTAVHATELAKLDVTSRRGSCAARKVGPTLMRFETLTVYKPAGVKRVKRLNRLDSTHSHSTRLGTNLEETDGGSGCRIGERLRRRFDDRDSKTSKLTQKQIPYQLAIIDIQPFRGSDKTPVVAGRSVQGGCQEKVYMKASELAGVKP